MLGGLEWPEGMAELALVCPFPPTVLTKAQELNATLGGILVTRRQVLNFTCGAPVVVRGVCMCV